MSNFNISNFITEINRSGVSKTNKFEVQILAPQSLQKFTPESRLVSLYCEVSNLPGMSISTKPFKLYGPAYQRPVSAEFFGEGITMTFLLDRDMNVKSFFDAWMFKTVNPNSFNVSYAKDNNGQSVYYSQIKISQLDENNMEKYSVYLEDAFPRAMGLVDLSSGATNQAGKLNVTFAYRRWFSDHPNYSGGSAKTNFDPKLKDPFTARAGSNPNNNPNSGTGSGGEPFRLEIRGTGNNQS